MIRLIHGDCLEEMEKLSQENIQVDLVLTDPPYGTTRCNWDNVIPFDEMWNCINKLSKPTTPILLFGTQPFLSELIHSNIKNFKYNLIWDKKCVSNPLLSKKRPLRVHEEIAVFYKKQPYYNPQKIRREGKPYNRVSDNAKKIKEANSQMLNPHYTSHYYVDDGTRYPKSIISQFPSQMEECVNNKRVHPTQKPVKLLEWIIKNYTKEDTPKQG